ncbi:hypothetical protein [Helicobacter pylori]|uniref:hypothetical protein n=1 Tax=Helicobacter pylori TaxID=210 RepID=UPI0002DCA1D1|nr:hypothetical protein [Helicobacter pylori]WQS14014.1 hypothetical protein KVD76_05545 [Helicobacter pylori]WQS23754.1 hypothetical protein KVD61_05570 [Helicobacter pylori]
MKQVIKRVLKGLLPNRFLNAYRNVENLGAIKEQIRSNVETLGVLKEQINSIANQVNSILWRAERVMSINELFVETPKEKVEGFIKSLHPIKTEHELVRWGDKHDGGYLIPNDFEGIRALFSPGVGGVSAFEEDFYRHCKPTNPNDIYIYIWQTNRSMSRY